jgi:hypothetical protein
VLSSKSISNEEAVTTTGNIRLRKAALAGVKQVFADEISWNIEVHTRVQTTLVKTLSIVVLVEIYVR